MRGHVVNRERGGVFFFHFCSREMARFLPIFFLVGRNSLEECDTGWGRERKGERERENGTCSMLEGGTVHESQMCDGDRNCTFFSNRLI